MSENTDREYALSFREALTQAAAEGWSGLIEASTGIEEIGTVMLHEGNLYKCACPAFLPVSSGG